MKKVIVISGGSDGVGKALARNLANDEHNDVVIISHEEKELAEVAHEIGCSYVVADVSRADGVERAIEYVIQEKGTIDCLINNAGIWIEGKLEDNNYQDIERVIDVNTKGVMFLTRATVPHMKRAGRGRIINVISQAGLHPKAERSVYHASKWAITGFTNSLSMELSPENISVIGFYPGWIHTDFFKKKGYEKDMTQHLDVQEVVRALRFIIDTPDDVVIPEFGIKKLGN